MFWRQNLFWRQQCPGLESPSSSGIRLIVSVVSILFPFHIHAPLAYGFIIPLTGVQFSAFDFEFGHVTSSVQWNAELV